MSSTKKSKDCLGDRMKIFYENVYRTHLPRRMPVIIRLDGSAFHTLTKKMDKPFDTEFKSIMVGVTEYLVKNIMGCKLGYVQSDEISLLLTDYDTIETEAWFNYNIQKITSISASMATAQFNKLYSNLVESKKVKDFGYFDSRVFVLPKEEVCNYFIFRQQDAVRNSIQGLGQKYFTHKEMHGKNNNVVQDMLMVQKGINWNDVDTYFKRGGCVYKGYITERFEKIQYTCNEIFEPCEPKTSYSTLGYKKSVVMDMDIPTFSTNKSFINAHVYLNGSELLQLEYINVAAQILEGVIPNEAVMTPIGYIEIPEDNTINDVVSDM